MSMIEWAENEIRIACELENPNLKEGEFDYGCACYKSALKAYKSLCEDGHSGASIGITKSILMRLIEGRPLTPIEDTDDVWNECGRLDDEKTAYQCRRMSSLFKYVYTDGTVKYNDIDRVYCYGITNPNITYHSSLVSRLINNMWPIVMPYCPDRAIKVACEDFLTDRRNGDFDTVGIYYAVKPDGTRVDVNRYFKCDDWIDEDWVEISHEDYVERYKISGRKD